MTQKFCQRLFFGCVLAVVGASAIATEPLRVQLRSRVVSKEDQSWLIKLRAESWQHNETAIVVCDMWDLHHCFRAVVREAEFAPRLDRLLRELRDQGVTIIHAPSGCMKQYENNAARARAINTPQAKDVPKGIDSWCHSIPAESKVDYPIDQSDGGEDDTAEEHEKWEAELKRMGKDPRQPWTRQIDAIGIDQSQDYISDSGREIWNILRYRKIKNVMLAGVHTNMCVLGRPFGLRQLAQNRVHVVLVRDMTDTMYNPAARPYVSHFTGTDLIVEHIERYVCPTITSDQIVGGKPFRFSEDRRPRVAIMVGEREYRTSQSLQRFAVEMLGKEYCCEWITPNTDDRNRFENIDVLDDCDALLVSVRRRTPPIGQLKRVQEFVRSGKPVIGIRTGSHAFSLRNDSPPGGYAQWPEFDAEVFGGNYSNHYGNSLKCTVEFTLNSKHPLLHGIEPRSFAAGGSLYRVRPLKEGATVLMEGSVVGASSEPVAWTFEREEGGRSFYTSLGHQDDFENPLFRGLLKNAIDWGVKR